MENVINVSDLKKLIATAHANLCVVLHALNTKILVGEINRPENSPPKIKRKRRTKKEMGVAPKMNLEKEYQAGRTGTGTTGVGHVDVTEHLNLPDADKGKAGEFWKKKKPGE